MSCAIGLIGARFAKGRMVILGYAAWGLLIFLFAMTGNLGLAIGLTFGQGVANMIFIIPSQTLFQERTPPDLMGRVVGFRFAVVFGSMTIAMALGSVLAEVFGPGPVIAVFGLVTAAAGLAGMLVPAGIAFGAPPATWSSRTCPTTGSGWWLSIAATSMARP